VEQIETIEIIDAEINKVIKDPSDADLERYYFYVENGTNDYMIAPLPDDQFSKFYQYLSQNLLNLLSIKELNDDLIRDVKKDYAHSMKKAIVDYILMNFEERDRLKIKWVPKNFNFR
jgi:dynein heavy chain